MTKRRRRSGFGAMAVKCGKWETEYPLSSWFTYRDSPARPPANAATYRRGCVANGNQIKLTVRQDPTRRQEALRWWASPISGKSKPTWEVQVSEIKFGHSNQHDEYRSRRFATVAAAKEAGDEAIVRWKREMELWG
jgi:hypothetical protein